MSPPKARGHTARLAKSCRRPDKESSTADIASKQGSIDDDEYLMFARFLRGKELTVSIARTIGKVDIAKYVEWNILVIEALES